MLSFIGKANMWQWGLLVFGTVILAFLELSLVATIPIFTGLVLEESVESKGFLFIPAINTNFLLVLMASLTAIRFVSQIAITKASHRYFSKIYTETVITLNSGYLGMNYLSFKELDLNTAIRNSTITVSNATFGVERFFDAAKSFILIVVLAFALGFYDISSLTIAAAASGIMVYLLKVNKKPTVVAGQNSHDAQAQMQALISESYRSFKELKFNNNTKFYKKNVGRSIQAYYHNFSISRMLPKFPAIYMESTIYLFITAGFAYWSLFLGNSGRDILPTVVFYLFVIRKLLPAFNEVMHYFLDFKVNQPAIKEINQEKEHIKKHGEALPASETLEFDELLFRNISFGYQGQENVLDHISFTVKRGERIALMGKSGSGKSTLSEIVASLIEPDAGSIQIDNTIINSLKPFRGEIGYLPQSFYVFSGSLLENILLSDVSPDQKRLDRCLEASMVTEFLSELESGLDTKLGEQGNLLSGGQRQRVALARVLYHDPKLLILDESTSSLDKTIENEVLKKIPQHYPDLSILFVTHRTETVVHFDRRFTLEKGSLTEGN